MPWNEQSGGNNNGSGGGRGPWGQGPSGGNGGPGNSGPDLEDLLRRGQERFRRAARRGGGGGGGNLGLGGLLIFALLGVGMWVGATGWYIVEPGEEGVVTRFGALERTTDSGFHWKAPFPIERAYTPQVELERSDEIGFRTQSTNREVNVNAESLMLTGDENIADIDFTVLWNINDSAAYLFNVEDPVATLRAAAESAMREVVGQTPLATLQTNDRVVAARRAQEITQQILNEYNAGISINSVNLRAASVPPQVIEAFNDVQSAEQDAERYQEEANQYANQQLEEANGQAARITQEAEGYRDSLIAEAEGEAQRFILILEEYEAAPEVTRRRMYLETMERVFGDMDKIIVDDNAGGVVPYLPLDELQRTNRSRSTSGGSQ